METQPGQRNTQPLPELESRAEFGFRSDLRPVVAIAAKDMLEPGMEGGCYAVYRDGAAISACNPKGSMASHGDVMGSAVELPPIVAAFGSGQLKNCSAGNQKGVVLRHWIDQMGISGQVGDRVTIRADGMTLVQVVVPHAPDSGRHSRPRILSFAVPNQNASADTVLEDATRAFPGLREPLEDARAKPRPLYNISLAPGDVRYKRDFVDATRRGGLSAKAFCGRDPEFMFSGKWKNPAPNGQVNAEQFTDAKAIFDVLWSGWRLSRLCDPAVTIDNYRRQAADVLVANMANNFTLERLVGRPKINVPMQIFLKIVNTFAEQAIKMDDQPEAWGWDRYLHDHGLGRSRLQIAGGSDTSELPFVIDPKLDVLRLDDETEMLVSPPDHAPQSLGVDKAPARDPREAHVLTAKKGGKHALPERHSRWRRAAAVVGVVAAATTAVIAGTSSHGSPHASTYGQASTQTLPRTSSHDWGTSGPIVLHPDGDSQQAEAPAPTAAPSYTEVKLGVYEPGPAGIGTVSGWALKGLMEQGVSDPTQNQIQVATYDIITASHLPKSNQGLQDLSPGTAVYIPHDLAKSVEDQTASQTTYAQAT